MNGKQTVTIKTRASEADKIGKPTVLTVNWDGATEDQVKALALRQIVVAVQQGFRKNGIPSTYTVNVSEVASGTRAALTPEQMIEALVEGAKTDPAKKAALEAKLRAAGFLK